jgi:hypothetical protein
VNWHVKRMFQADAKCLAAVAILAGAMSGQALVVEDLLVDAMLERRRRDGTTTGLHEEDVRKVVREVYERAGATGSVWSGMVSTYRNMYVYFVLPSHRLHIASSTYTHRL